MKRRPVPIRFMQLVMLSALVCLGDARPLLSEPLSKFERERARMIVKIIKDDIGRFYYDPTYHGIDLDAAFSAANEKIEQAASNAQSFAAIARPLLQFKDSHTFFLPPARSVRLEYGWHMKMVGDRCFVTAVEDGSDAAAKGLKRGDIIVSIDGFALTRENLWGVNYVYRALAPRETVRLKIQSPGGQPRDLEVVAKVQQKKRLLQLTTSSDVEDYIHDIEDRAHLDRHRLEDLGDDLLIWKMPQFDLSPSEVKNSMRMVEKHKALILDLRGNGGGAVETLGAMVGSFLDGETKIGDVESREPMKPVVGKATGEAWKGKLIVLIDGQSASASELFARVMQLEKRATVIGDRSSGSVMMSRSYPHEIGSGTLIVFATSITIANIIMKDGKSLEHTGVEPDETMLPAPEDIAAGRDPVLSHAASLCGVTIDPAKAGSYFPVEWSKRN
jgi:C-terminal processing protease CtpA/Prc